MRGYYRNKGEKSTRRDTSRALPFWRNLGSAKLAEDRFLALTGRHDLVSLAFRTFSFQVHRIMLSTVWKITLIGSSCSINQKRLGEVGELARL